MTVVIPIIYLSELTSNDHSTTSRLCLDHAHPAQAHPRLVNVMSQNTGRPWSHCRESDVQHWQTTRLSICLSMVIAMEGRHRLSVYSLSTTNATHTCMIDSISSLCRQQWKTRMGLRTMLPSICKAKTTHSWCVHRLTLYVGYVIAAWKF